MSDADADPSCFFFPVVVNSSVSDAAGSRKPGLGDPWSVECAALLRQM